MIDVDAIRRALSNPADVCARLGWKGKRQPRGVTILCPWHKENSASCSVVVASDGTIAARCFGCGTSGDVLHLVAAARGLDIRADFAAVAEAARELAGLEPEPAAGPDAAPAPPTVSTLAFDAIFGCLDSLFVSSSEPVAAYLDRRRLLEAAYEDGWRALPLRRDPQRELVLSLYQAVDGRDDVPEEHRPRFTRPDLDGCGFFADGGFVHPANLVCIPWRDQDGRVQTVQRRRLDEGKPKYVFPNGRRPALPYGIERLVPGADVVLVEGAVDAIAIRPLAAQLLGGAVPLGIPGTSGWLDGWAEIVRGRRVLLAFDADDAGDRAAAELGQKLTAAAAVERIRPRGRKDWAA